jgi:hypothetical protein
MKALMAVLVVVALVVPAAGANTLTVVRLADGASLEAAGDLGAVVRHVGIDHAVVEGAGDVPERLASRGLDARALARPRAGATLYLSYPRYSVERLSDVGEVLWHERHGAAIVACPKESFERLLSLSYSARELPERIDVDSWFDDSPPAHVSDRTAADERALRGVVEDVISGISPDSLMAHVIRLAEYPGGELRSRYVLREECLTEARTYIADRLSEYLPARATVDTQRFMMSGYTCTEGPDGPIIEYPADNVIGVLPGTGRLSGCYVICAHYDAIAKDTPEDEWPYPITDPPWFWWCENPAPGADDNATGVAVVLEAARALSGLSFPFDIRFVLLSGEELGLHGSHAYADSVAGYRAGHDDPVAPADTIYGVLNVDMIAFKPSPDAPDTCDIVTNPGSTWLANWIVDTAETHYPGLFPDYSARRIDKALAYSDHAPFWENDYDATAALEHWNPRDRNDNYHTISDDVSTVYPSQFASTARMIIGAVARLADPQGQFNLAVFPDDLVLYATTAGGTEYHTDHFVIGQPAPIRVDFHAFGPEGNAEVTLEVWDGEPDEGTLVSSANYSGPMGGGETKSHEFDWDIDEDDLGAHLFSVRLVVTGDDELTLTDNVALDIPVRVDSPELFIADHFPWPNPTTDETGFHIAYQLSRGTEGKVLVKVFDITGQEVAESVLYYYPNATNEGVQPGLNSIGWELIDAEGAGLTSGVYVYQITLYDEGRTDPVDQVMGKFAVTR